MKHYSSFDFSQPPKNVKNILVVQVWFVGHSSPALRSIAVYYTFLAVASMTAIKIRVNLGPLYNKREEICLCT